MNSIAVFCGSNLGKEKAFSDVAEAVGVFLAKNNLTLIYGGANVGLMRVTAEASLANQGKAIGVITHFLAKKHLAQDGLEELILVDNMQERKAKMTELADAFIILPGGCGSMEEFFEVFTAAQLGFHAKPIIILDTNGYYKHLKALLEQMIKQGMMLAPHVNMVGFYENIEDAYQFMLDYKPPVLDKWIDDIRKENGQ